LFSVDDFEKINFDLLTSRENDLITSDIQYDLAAIPCLLTFLEKA